MSSDEEEGLNFDEEYDEELAEYQNEVEQGTNKNTHKNKQRDYEEEDEEEIDPDHEMDFRKPKSRKTHLGEYQNEEEDLYKTENFNFAEILQNEAIEEDRQVRANFLSTIFTQKANNNNNNSFSIEDSLFTLRDDTKSTNNDTNNFLNDKDYLQMNPHLILGEQQAIEMIEKKKREDAYKFERERIEFLKMTRKVRSNPEEYRNLIKAAVLCELASGMWLVKSEGNDDATLAKILSMFDQNDLIFMESMRNINKQSNSMSQNKEDNSIESDTKHEQPLHINQPKQYSSEQIAKTVCYNLSKIAQFKWNRESFSLAENLEILKFSYSQLTLIAYQLLQYFGVQVRFTKIIDLRYLNLDKKHLSKANSRNQSVSQKSKDKDNQEETNSRQSNKHSDMIESLMGNRKAVRYTDMASRIADNLMESVFKRNKKKNNNIGEDEEDSDNNSDDYDEEKNKDKMQKSIKRKERETNYTDTQTGDLEKDENQFEDFLSSFKFNKKQVPNNKNNKSSELLTTQKKLSPINAHAKKSDILEEDEMTFEKKDKNVTARNSEFEDTQSTFENFETQKQQESNDKKENYNNEDEEEEEELLNPFSFAFVKGSLNAKNAGKQTDNTKNSDATGSQSFKTQGSNDYLSPSEVKFWLEIFNEKKNEWISFDPVLVKTLSKNEIISKQQESSRASGLLTVFDLTDLHVERFLKAQVSRRELNLEYWWKKILIYNSFIGDPNLLKEPYKQAIISQRTLSDQLKKVQIPMNYSEYRVSDVYIVRSMLLKYQGLKPNAQKTGLTFKDEEVYNRSDVVELHARTRWRTHQRQVRAGEQPSKQVQSILGNKKMVDLFGEWQTDPLVYGVTSEGKLPRNEYGNWETFVMAPVEGTVLIELPGLPKLLKKANIEYVEAVSGFEQNASGRSHVIKKGVLAHSRDEERIRQIYEDNHEIMKAQQAIQLKKNLLSLWRKVFQGVLLKKSITDRMHAIQM